MNDLLSRKALLEALVKAEEECEEAMTVPSFATAIYAIRKQPIAYDTDKVVEQLKKEHQEAKEEYNRKSDSYYEGKMIAFNNAIEIVKGDAKQCEIRKVQMEGGRVNEMA